jgi:hypothetical protein
MFECPKVIVQPWNVFYMSWVKVIFHPKTEFLLIVRIKKFKIKSWMFPYSFQKFGSGPERLHNIVAGINMFQPKALGLSVYDWNSLAKTKLLSEKLIQPHSLKVTYSYSSSENKNLSLYSESCLMLSLVNVISQSDHI